MIRDTPEIRALSNVVLDGKAKEQWHTRTFKNGAILRLRGAKVLLAAPLGTPGANLPIVETGAIDLDPIALIQSFYPMVEMLARARGRNPDEPRFLAKVTKTH